MTQKNKKQGKKERNPMLVRNLKRLFYATMTNETTGVGPFNAVSFIYDRETGEIQKYRKTHGGLRVLGEYEVFGTAIVKPIINPGNSLPCFYACKIIGTDLKERIHKISKKAKQNILDVIEAYNKVQEYYGPKWDQYVEAIGEINKSYWATEKILIERARKSGSFDDLDKQRNELSKEREEMGNRLIEPSLEEAIEKVKW
jgi:hypothetical protein